MNEVGSPLVMYFTFDQAARLGGVTRVQLGNWDRSGFFKPSYGYEDRKSSQSRLYTFRDLACLRVISALRNESRVSMQHLREVKTRLQHLGEDSWARTTLWVLNRRVIFQNPETGGREDIVSGQQVMQIPLATVTGNLEKDVLMLKTRSPANVGKIVETAGKDYVAGTRIPVSAIRSFAEEGYSNEEILKQYPTLSEDDVKAALRPVAA